nr:Chain S, DIPEPTIDYL AMINOPEPTIDASE B [Saccharomyces cerevisiae]
GIILVLLIWGTVLL